MKHVLELLNGLIGGLKKRMPSMENRAIMLDMECLGKEWTCVQR